MEISFYNSLTRTREIFKPRVAGKVSLYSCGPTVYDYAHIGNLRSFAFSDLLHRTLELFGYDVTRIMNITDVDDKTIRTAREKGVGLDAVTRPFETAFLEDMKTLGMRPAAGHPRATEHVAEMISMIQDLITKGHAYVTEGSVYFRIESFPQYGRLMNLKMDEQRVKASARMASDEYEKEEVSDFVLWKAFVQEDGSVVWDSPWGKGRPGWHIECSAMSRKYLGDSFDLHTGGMDNKFPHHENEIAQSECATGHPFVSVWLHASHLRVDNKKMSKSAGNFYTLRDLLAKGYDPMAIRHLLVSTHYRNFLNFTLEGITASAKAISRVNLFAQEISDYLGANPKEGDGQPGPLGERAAAKAHRFRERLSDDLDVSGALGALFEFLHEAREVKKDWNPTGARAARALLRDAQSVFGCFQFENTPKTSQSPLPEEVQILVDQRQQARARKDFAESDRLRGEIEMRGYSVKDGPRGQTLERK